MNKLFAQHIAILDHHVAETMKLTSKGRLSKPNERPTFQLIETQRLANDVVIMQAIRNLIWVLTSDPADETPPDSESKSGPEGEMN